MTEIKTKDDKKNATKELVTVRLKDPITAVIPQQYCTAQRFMTSTMWAFARCPALYDCTQASIAKSVITCAELGLEPHGALGLAYLIPYKHECTVIIGYKGYIQLAWRSGMVKNLDSILVREGDEFYWEDGLTPVIRHIPDLENTGKIKHIYSFIEVTNGGLLRERMTYAEIEKVRARSRAANAGPWVTDWEAMAKKTPLRRLMKRTPLTPQLEMATAIDEKPEAGMRQELSPSIDITAYVDDDDSALIDGENKNEK